MMRCAPQLAAPLGASVASQCPPRGFSSCGAEPDPGAACDASEKAAEELAGGHVVASGEGASAAVANAEEAATASERPRRPGGEPGGEPAAQDEAERTGEEEVLLHTDAAGRLRGRCGCGCEGWKLSGFSSLRWNLRGVNSIDLLLEEKRLKEESSKHSKHCERCGCEYHLHQDEGPWLEAVRSCAAHFRSRMSDPGSAPRLVVLSKPAQLKEAKDRTVPRESAIPAAALRWSPEDVALHLLSLGKFDPRLHRRPAPSAPLPSSEDVLISVITPTSSHRKVFHPLVYECFRQQSYPYKELVIVDNGDSPNTFLEARAKEDPRVVYRFFRGVVDSQEADRMDSVLTRNQSGKVCSLSTARREKDDDRAAGAASPQVAPWSLGLKRNIAVSLARGAVIAHFDDDDLYAPDYLAHMLPALRHAEGLVPAFRFDAAARCQGFLPAAATLAQWHMVNAEDQTFGWFDPKNEPLLGEIERDNTQYGYGFSFLYTRAAWQLVPFPDVEYSEDGEFTGRLMCREVPIQLVRTEGVVEALAAHTYHADTTSAGEFAGEVRLGYGVPTPGAFRTLLPCFKEVCQSGSVRRTKCHKVRREMYQLLQRCNAPDEVSSWDKKEEYLRLNPEPPVQKAQAAGSTAPAAGRLPPGYRPPPARAAAPAGHGRAKLAPLPSTDRRSAPQRGVGGYPTAPGGERIPLSRPAKGSCEGLPRR